jgi:transposase
MESKKAARSRRKFDATFKKDVLKMIESGRSVADVSASLGIAASLVHRWVKAAGLNSSPPLAAQPPAFDAEKAALHKKIRELEMEREILKKALGIFSRQTP